MDGVTLRAAPPPQRQARPPTIEVIAILIGGLPTRMTAPGAADAIKIKNPDSGIDLEIVVYTTDGQRALAWK